MNQEQQSYNSSYMNNSQYVDASAIMQRLDTTKKLEEFEMNLRGERDKIVTENGQPVLIKAKTGKSRANDFGVQRIITFMSNVFNGHIAQGNIDRNEKNQYLCNYRKRLAAEIMLNRYEYDISIGEYSGIMSDTFAPIELFVSRPVNNEERKLLGVIAQIRENTQSMIRDGKKFGGLV